MLPLLFYIVTTFPFTITSTINHCHHPNILNLTPMLAYVCYFYFTNPLFVLKTNLSLIFFPVPF